MTANRISTRALAVGVVGLLAALAVVVWSLGRSTGEATTPVEAERPAAAPADPATVQLTPGIRIDRVNRHVDVDAKVCLSEGALELIATTPGGKTHESIFAIEPRPRHLHAALKVLGLQSGAPGEFGALAASGDRVRVDVIVEKDGEESVTPVNVLVVHRETAESLPANVFVFAGSHLARPEEGDGLVYAADVVGDVITLVSFEDEVLALPEPASADNDRLAWEIETSCVPDVGTPVVLRISPLTR